MHASCLLAFEVALAHVLIKANLIKLENFDPCIVDYCFI